MTSSDLKVSLLQTDIIWENKEANLAHYSDLLAQVPTDCQLVVLPEMFSTGFSMNPEQYAEPMQGETLQWMKTEAKKHGIALTGSCMIAENSKYYNRLFFVFPDGSVQHYDKRHLFRMGNEHEHYAAGTRRLIVTYLGWRICPLICYDLRFPVYSRNQNDYDCLIYAVSWPAIRTRPWEILTVARAIENQCYVLAVNRIGIDNSGSAHDGKSTIISPKGEILADAPVGKEAIITTVLSYDELQQSRAKFPVAADADKFNIIY